MQQNEQTIRDYLQSYRRKTIDLDLLKKTFRRMNYEEFQFAIKRLLKDELLQEMPSGGHDFGGLPRRMRLNASILSRSVELVQSDALRFALSPQLDLSSYYVRPADVWKMDLPYIIKLSDWLKNGGSHGIPVSDQKRSWEIFYDEKYLLGDGRRLLQRLHIAMAELEVIEESDPLMLAVNPLGLHGTVCHHLIVENKAPYRELLPILRKTGFSSLILGYGWKITKNLPELPVQTGRTDAKHIAWYFGDFDWEGLKIWWYTAARTAGVTLKLAVPFYRAFLNYEAPTGKGNQQKDDEVWEAFSHEIGPKRSLCFYDLLKHGRYYPQEILTEEDLMKCWEELARGTGTLF